jgi:hypothetical protein
MPDTLGPELLEDELVPIEGGDEGDGVEEDQPALKPVEALLELRLELLLPVLMGSAPNEPLVGGGGGGNGVTRLPPLIGSEEVESLDED